MIYTAKANQLYNLGDDVKKIKAKILFVPAASDLDLSAGAVEARRRALSRAGRRRGSRRSSKATAATSTACFNVAKQGEAIRAFLAR